MLKQILKMIKKNYLIILIILAIIAVCITCMNRSRESFKLIELVTPPLDILETSEYAYGCQINGYKCDPHMIYKVVLQGKGLFQHMKYLKYKIIDTDNIVRYSGLFRGTEGLPVGSYVTFDNGKEMIITSLDVNSVPKS